MALAAVLAVLTFIVVNGAWRRAAPPAPARPTSVEVRLVATPPAAAPAASR